MSWKCKVSERHAPAVQCASFIPVPLAGTLSNRHFLFKLHRPCCRSICAIVVAALSRSCRQMSLKVQVVAEHEIQSYLSFAKHTFKELRKLFPSSAS